RDRARRRGFRRHDPPRQGARPGRLVPQAHRQRAGDARPHEVLLAAMHYPLLWRFRLLRALRAKGSWQNRKLLGAQARAEGGNARFNPLNTTEPWPLSWPYNIAGVRNYRTGT